MIILDVPEVSISTIGLATWGPIENSSGYIYVIDGGTEVNVPNTTTYVILQDGQSIKVKALGDGDQYLDSAYSEIKTYEAPKAPEVLSTPVVNISDLGLATWDAVPNALGYMYLLDGGSEQVLPATTTYLVLQANQSLQVKAIGDGEEYLSSEYSELKTYVVGTIPVPEVLSIPVVTISESGLASWSCFPQESKLTPFY